MKSKLLLTVCFNFFISLGWVFTAVSVEPNMADYTSYPAFMTQTVKPNILVILDNSGSMNYSAYGAWPGDGGTVTDSPYIGNTPYCGEVNVRVIQSRDDSEEDTSYGGNWYNNADLDLGSFEGGGNQALTGIRFQRVTIPQGSIITSAYIRFTAHDNESDATSLSIRCQLSDNPIQFSDANYNISNRANTTASVAWNAVPAWTTNNTYDTPDLVPIIQEIVNQGAWNSGNALVFKISGTGKRDAKAFDNSSSQAPFLHVVYTPVSCTRYYGYFDPDSQYSYSSGVFSRDAAGPWNGNWLNWLAMRRVDVARKVLVGGKASSRAGDGITTLTGDPHAQQTGRYYKKWFDTSLSGVSLSPYNGNRCYGVRDGKIYVGADAADANPFDNTSFYIKVNKVATAEPDDFFNGNVAGVLQRVADNVRFGLEFYNTDRGGTIVAQVDSGITTIVTEIETEDAQTWTPLAEALYEGVRYFQQVAPFYYASDYTKSNVWDPYYWEDLGSQVACAKSFILLITDGESTYDQEIPAWLQDYDGDGHDPGTYADNGTNYLDDVALWAHTTDLRSSGTTLLAGDQTIGLYTVFAFGAGSQLLQDAAKNGGFIDSNGNKQPDLQSEYDTDDDDFPDTYFESDDGYELEHKLILAITDMLKRTASGSAVSVLSTSGEGEGNLVQAFFRPVVTPSGGGADVKWTGYLQSLWVDSYGYLREDTDGDLALDVTKDKVIKYFFDSSDGTAKIKQYDVSSVTPYPDAVNDYYTIVALDIIKPLWEAGKNLSEHSADDRKIFTYLDKDKDNVFDEPMGDDDPFDDQGEVVQFTVSGVSAIKPYLGVANYTSWKYLGNTHDARANNLIQYIRGKESGFTGTSTLKVRTRTIDGDVWKLGDIVNSTPVTITKPPDNYHLIYADASYFDYWWAYRNREMVVYVGANDGMLHAFTSWYYDRSGTTGHFIRPSGSAAPEQIGDELWAYIPQTLLPHLKWLASDSYTHAYYVDLQPKVFDAKIFSPDAKHPGGWGTILVCGLNMGGKNIWAEDSFDNGTGTFVSEKRLFYPSYFAMDVTDPRNPRLLWERTYTDLKMTTCIPAVMKVNEKWFLIFGSGPDTYQGTSTSKGHIYVADLKTGDTVPDPSFASGVTNAWRFETGESNAFMSSACTLDMDLNYNVDAAYLGETYYQSSIWKGKLFKVAVPWDSWGTGVTSTYHDDPLDWKCTVLFNAAKPITAAPTISLDSFDNVWVYFGTGRYIHEDDKINSDTQYLFGVKDPFFNDKYSGTYYHNYTSSLTLDITNLFNADPYLIYLGGTTVYQGATYFGTWDDLLSATRIKEGWYRTLTTTKERAVRKPTVLGGLVLLPSFVPGSDICGFGGDSYLYGLYYETGTAYYESIFQNGVLNNIVLDKISLGIGAASALGIHVGREIGARAYIQQSTGTIIEEEVKPAFDIKSNLRSWRENWN